MKPSRTPRSFFGICQLVLSPLILGLTLVVSINLFGLLGHSVLTSNVLDNLHDVLTSALAEILTGSLQSQVSRLLFSVSLLVIFLTILHFRGRDPHLASWNPAGLILILVMLFPILAVLTKNLYVLIFDIVTSETVKVNNFTVSSFLALSWYILVCPPSVLKRQTWKKLKDGWLNWWNFRQVTALIFLAQEWVVPNTGLPFKIAWEVSQLGKGSMFSIYALSLGTTVVATYLHQAGLARTESDDTNSPKGYFVPALLLAILSNISAASIILNGALLTLYAYA